MPWSINLKMALYALAVLVLTATHVVAWRDGAEHIAAKWDAQKAVDAQALADAERKARDAEFTLQQRTSDLQKEKQDEIERLNQQHSIIVDGLRKRPARPAVVPMPAPAAVTESPCQCDGRQLYREDAEFLIRQARRADAVKIELEACYQQYEQARQLNQN
jgi:hypothetical protein